MHGICGYKAAPIHRSYRWGSCGYRPSRSPCHLWWLRKVRFPSHSRSWGNSTGDGFCLSRRPMLGHHDISRERGRMIEREMVILMQVSRETKRNTWLKLSHFFGGFEFLLKTNWKSLLFGGLDLQSVSPVTFAR